MLVTPFLLLAWVTLDHVTQGQVFGVSQKCLDCICDASSGCDATKQCHTAQNGGYFCGAYQISWPYWADGGRLGDRGQPADFESCLNNKLCSEATIVGYMKKWAQDCNGDGVVNCIDYAAIHVTGGTNCRPDWLGRSSYWRKFSQSQCFAEARGARASGRDFVESPNQGRPRRPARPAQPTPQAPRPTAQPAPPLPRRPPPQSQPSQPRAQPQPQPSQPRAQPQPPPVRQPAGRGNGRVSWTFANSTTIVVAERDPLLPFPGAFEDGFEPSRMRPLAGEVPNVRPPPEVSRPAPRQPERRQPEISLPPVPRVPEAAPTVRPFQPEPAPAQPSRPRPRNSTFAASGRAPSGPVPGECMDCLCQASSGCDPSKQCAGDFCGPFLISWSYWSDGGSPGGDYVKCALDKQCAATAIQGYMTKWTRDCNGDGVVDCDDFAAIHKLGPHMCREESVTSTDYWKAFDKCSAATTGSGVIQPRNLAGRSIAPDSDASRAESIPRETVAPRSSNDLADPFDGTRDPADSSLFNNVPPIGSLRDNSISLPEVAKPVGVSLPTPPSRLMEPTPPIVTPRPDLPLITPRRSLATHLVANFRRGRLLATTEKPKVEISSECLACICEASSQCNPDTGCSLSQNGAQVCGPYQFDRNYWSASGSGSADFERCALDQDCAEDAVRSYTAKNTLDCNDDGNIDCLDFAAIHRAGPKACNSQWLIDSTYWSDFQNCYGFGR